MRMVFDPDEFETVFEYRECTRCRGDLSKCDGGCNGMGSFTQVRRDPAEVAKIKADRRRKEEDEILKQADVIRVRRNLE